MVNSITPHFGPRHRNLRYNSEPFAATPVWGQQLGGVSESTHVQQFFMICRSFGSGEGECAYIGEFLPVSRNMRWIVYKYIPASLLRQANRWEAHNPLNLGTFHPNQRRVVIRSTHDGAPQCFSACGCAWSRVHTSQNLTVLMSTRSSSLPHPPLGYWACRFHS